MTRRGTMTGNVTRTEKAMITGNILLGLKPLIFQVINTFPMIVVFPVIVIFLAFWGQKDPFLGPQEYCRCPLSNLS